MFKVNNWLSIIQRWLYPPTCVLSGSRAEGPLDLSDACRAELEPNPEACRSCAIPLSGGGLCGQCLQNPPHFDAAFAPFIYTSPLDALIVSLKFRGRINHALVLGHLMAEAIEQTQRALPQRLIPVPLHRSRLRQRGYNQALEIARPIARRFAIPLDFHSCQRIRATAAQSILPAAERRKNVRSAFQVTREIDASHVAIIDDVMTTGHTVNELARMLKQAGIKTVEVWVCARARG
jgi:ComF family protein